MSMRTNISRLSILFLALAAISISLDKKPASSLGYHTQKAIALAPTIFPIVFAAITGKFFRTLGLHWAERGVQLGTLERLVGCQSLFAAIERQIALRGANSFGLGIIIIWALSPIGGQAALRLLGESQRTVSYNSTIRFLPIELAQQDTTMSGYDDVVEGWPSYGPTFMTALKTTRKLQNSTQDLFGNIKIPVLSKLDSVSNGSWTTVDYSKEVPYSSLLGIPIAGIPSDGNSSFQILSRYWTINCPKLTYIPSFNTRPHYNKSSALLKTSVSTFIMQSTSTSSDTDHGSFNLTSISSVSDSDVSVAYCDLAYEDVESMVRCQNQDCSVIAMKNATTAASTKPVTVVPMINTLSALPQTTIGYLHHASKEESTLLEQWLADPTADFVSFIYSNLSTLDPSIFSRNMEVAYNTFWQSTYGAAYLTGNLSSNLSTYDNISTSYELPLYFNSSQASMVRFDGREYHSNKAFGGILFIISFLLLCEAVASVVLRINTLAPDILGYVSSLTRDNPYVGASGASHLDGLERARALQALIVTLGDVNVGAEIGHITLTASENVQRLKKQRLYD
ncbi:hypothetical protein LSUB1_G007567 [Lachnellula subtilissima]|uniref:Carboxylic ester hydrolase n=1 Tax=Lachnellula subtilissima TaxID=602034 RepID=A0A8H8RHZ5_9HELO|nr:hypothetical protein LSUB1_G007567 [Lachnellula subtilissima]